jgi:hypothetical protein
VISFQKPVMVKSRQILRPFLTVWPWKETLKREQTERDVLEPLGEYKCDAGMSVETVPVVVNIQTLKGRFIAHKFSSGWVVGVVVSSLEKKPSVAGQFA